MNTLGTWLGVKSIMFLAHDILGHSVCWSGIANKWMVENKRDGLIVQCDNLPKALAEMQERVLTEAVLWSIVDNPYGD